MYSARLKSGEKRCSDMPARLFHLSKRFNKLPETVTINYIDLEDDQAAIINEPSSVVI